MAAAAMGESQCEATRQKRMKKKPKPDGAGFGVAPSQSPLPAATFLQTHTQSPAPGTPILEEAVAVRKRKVRNDQKAAAEGDKHGKEPMLAATTTMKKKKKHRERRSSPSLSAAAAAKEPILQQGPEVNTEQKRNNEEGPSTAQLLQDPAQSPALGAQILEEATTEAAMRKWKMRDEKRVAVLPFAQNQEQTEERVLAVTTKKKKRKRRESKSSPSLTAAATVEAPILQQEAKVTKKRLPHDPTHAQSQGTKASHAAKPLSAATFLEAPTQPPASRTPMLEEAAVAVMSEGKICKDQKVAALPLSENTTLEEPVLAATMMKKKKHKGRKSSPSLTDAAAAEAPILQQEAEVTKKPKRRKEEGPSTYSPLQLHPGLTQSEGTKVSHALKPLPAATFFKDPAQYTAPRAPMLEKAAAVMSKRKICKEQRVAAVCLAQNTTLEEQRDDTMAVKEKKESNHMKHTLSSISASAASETTIWEQKVKVTKKQKQRKQQEPSGKSPLSLHPGQTHSAQSQGGKAPPEQEGEADARKGSSIKKSNGKMPCVRVLSNRKLIKEASKRQPALPEGFVPFSDFVSNCTEQNPDESLPYRAFFDQFRYNPVRGDHKPPLPRTPDHLARLLPRANETSKASKTNNSVVCKSKKKDSGPGSQEKLHPQVKENPKKMGTTKQRQPPPLLTPAEKCSDIYRRVPLDQLVPPPRSPHNLLQEKYASDPWKVIVICMLLNLTQGKQVSSKIIRLNLISVQTNMINESSDSLES
jgi:methyl-CpG-binding domain protein 4